MAIRKPSVFSQNDLIFQDFLYAEDPPSELRYIVAKYDGEKYEIFPQTFDYPDPSYRGGSIVARVDYTVTGKVITIDHWEVFWRDEWPLRLTIQFLLHCLYSESQGYVARVAKDAYPFWVSEWFHPITNSPDDHLVSFTVPQV